jgi:hypothetical protein
MVLIDVHGRMQGLMDAWMGGCKESFMDGWIDALMDRYISELGYGWNG